VNYFDTSALIKRFVAERGSDLVHTIMADQEYVATAKIAYAEVHAALARRHRDRDPSGGHYSRASQQFENEWQGYVRVDLWDEVLLLARDLVRRHPLRGFDAIHLASAIRLQRELGEEIRFLAADARLLQVAQAERLPALNVETARRA
jgi:predicted nucleic acid-binding protein